MKLQVTGQIEINAPAADVWRDLAHEFAQMGQWAAAIPTSTAVITTPGPNGTPVSGRVCTTAVSGFADVEEQFTYFDEPNMRFGYKAIKANPSFIKNAKNNCRQAPECFPLCWQSIKLQIGVIRKITPILYFWETATC